MNLKKEWIDMWCRLVSKKYIASTFLVGSCDRSFLNFSFIVYIIIGTSGDVISPRPPLFNPRDSFCVNPSSSDSPTSRHPATAARTSSGSFCEASSVSANSQQRTRSTRVLVRGHLLPKATPWTLCLCQETG